MKLKVGMIARFNRGYTFDPTTAKVIDMIGRFYRVKILKSKMKEMIGNDRWTYEDMDIMDEDIQTQIE